uniref:Bloodthirsty-related gene family, member 30 n=1 Tax=Haplochromis burtoni TaxID=8153 RepID=A0A3Q2VSE4_HAPBU
MAESAELFTEQELTCSICLDLFTDPVSTPCGHNFCQACIGGYWASSAVSTCPLCKHQFEGRPQLSINKVFAQIAEKYKQTHYAPLPSPFVWCDVCTGIKQPAVSSCLTCTASYCTEHVQPHHTTPFYAKHPLMDPQEALRGRTCSVHRRLMEVYCRTCESCICAICVLEEHRMHKTVSVQTERLSKQILNRIKEKEIPCGRRWRCRSLLTKHLNPSVFQSYADRERSEVEHLLNDLSGSLDQIRSHVVGGIVTQLDTVMTKGEGMVNRLEEELSQLTERRAALEAQATSQDHIAFLKVRTPAATDPRITTEAQADDDSQLVLHFHLGEVKLALSEVKEKMEEIRTGEIRSRGLSSAIVMTISASRGPCCYVYLCLLLPEDVTLNPVTAYPFLILSEDRKQVKRGEKLQFYRNSPHRFDVWSCVLAKEGFSSGRHYWEVCVGENKDWKLGVVSESAQRKGLFDMCPSHGYYAIWWSSSQLRALTTPPLTKVKGHHPKLRQVGVFLDMEEGQVSLYNVKSGSEIYSFHTSTEFTERMFPLLGTGDKEVPLILLTTLQHPA